MFRSLTFSKRTPAELLTYAISLLGYAVVLIALTLLAMGSQAAQAEGEAYVFESGVERASVVELYTSEGCSSCPPADQWLSSLSSSPDLWKKFVPVAFHVTYWDYLGWQDRFAVRSNDQRQRLRAKLDRTGVYTPGVFVNGTAWRSWRRNPGALSHHEAAEVGKMRVEMNATSAHIRFAPNAKGRALQPVRVELVWLDGDITSRVARGENRGRTLKHDFISRGVITQELQQSDGQWHAQIELPEYAFAKHQAVAVWIVGKDQRPIQAVGGWLPMHNGLTFR